MWCRLLSDLVKSPKLQDYATSFYARVAQPGVPDEPGLARWGGGTLGCASRSHCGPQAPSPAPLFGF
jgi:hypothetical protein